MTLYLLRRLAPASLLALTALLVACNGNTSPVPVQTILVAPSAAPSALPSPSPSPTPSPSPSASAVPSVLAIPNPISNLTIGSPQQVTVTGGTGAGYNAKSGATNIATISPAFATPGPSGYATFTVTAGSSLGTAQITFTDAGNPALSAVVNVVRASP